MPPDQRLVNFSDQDEASGVNNTAGIESEKTVMIYVHTHTNTHTHSYKYKHQEKHMRYCTITKTQMHKGGYTHIRHTLYRIQTHGHMSSFFCLLINHLSLRRSCVSFHRKVVITFYHNETTHQINPSTPTNTLTHTYKHTLNLLQASFWCDIKTFAEPE